MKSPKYFLEQHRWFKEHSRDYIGPYTLGDRLYWPIAWVKFMWYCLTNKGGR